MSNPTIELLASYPCQGPPLTARHKKIYLQEYIRNRQAAGGLSKLVAHLESWMHRSVAGSSGEVLEIGAGTLNHLFYEQFPIGYDVVEPVHDFYQGVQAKTLVRRFYDDISEIAAGVFYDRIVSVAVLEHLNRSSKKSSSIWSLAPTWGIFRRWHSYRRRIFVGAGMADDDRSRLSPPYRS